MFVSFGRTLFKLGSIRVGFRMRGTSGCFLACLYLCINAMIYICWYSMLGALWLMYGMCYLFFYLPIKALIKWSKKKKTEDTSYE